MYITRSSAIDETARVTITSVMAIGRPNVIKQQAFIRVAAKMAK